MSAFSLPFLPLNSNTIPGALFNTRFGSPDMSQVYLGNGDMLTAFVMPQSTSVVGRQITVGPISGTHLLNKSANHRISDPSKAKSRPHSLNFLVSTLVNVYLLHDILKRTNHLAHFLLTHHLWRIISGFFPPRHIYYYHLLDWGQPSHSLAIWILCQLR